MEYYKCKICLAQGNWNELQSHECQGISNRYLDDPDFPSLIEPALEPIIEPIALTEPALERQVESQTVEGKEQVESGGSEIDG
jgi:hypothetical protein